MGVLSLAEILPSVNGKHCVVTLLGIQCTPGTDLTSEFGAMALQTAVIACCKPNRQDADGFCRASVGDAR